MWNDAVITNVGISVLNQWAGGGTLTITHASSGSGMVAASLLMAQTGISDEREVLPIVSYQSGADGVQYKVQFMAAETAYTAHQIGVWGKLDDGADTLLAIYQDAEGVKIPDKTDMPDFVFAFYALVQMNGTGQLAVTIDPSALVSSGTLAEVLGGYARNGHTHDAVDVGLGNVPNVATNDQTPTYTTATANAELTSGEKLSAAFGKIAKAVSSLIAHLADVTKHITGTERSAWNGKAKVVDFTATIPETGWAGSAAPYSVTVSVSGILDTDRPFVDIIQTGTEATDKAMRENYGKITRVVTAANSVTFYAAEKPSAVVPVQMRVVR